LPELPEVETVRLGLHKRLSGQAISFVKQRRRDLRIPFPSKFVENLVGQQLVKVGRRGKYILLHFLSGRILIIHLGMSGRLIICDGGPDQSVAHEHVVIGFTEGLVMTYRDPRRFGLMSLTRENEISSHQLFNRMGPEPLDQSFNGQVLAKAFRGRRASVKNLLMDQSIIAGLGNIYACESLFRAGIDPHLEAGSISVRRIGRLSKSIQSVLSDAINAGGSSLRDYVQASGEMGYFQHQWNVYGRAGLPCGGCNNQGSCSVKQIKQSGRSTYWCPRKQK